MISLYERMGENLIQFVMNIVELKEEQDYLKESIEETIHNQLLDVLIVAR